MTFLLLCLCSNAILQWIRNQEVPCGNRRLVGSTQGRSAPALCLLSWVRGDLLALTSLVEEISCFRFENLQI